jgi:thiol-disulfide isomerase/thioredoxin
MPPKEFCTGMLPRLFLKARARRLAAAFAVFALVALAASCENDGASKKRAEEARLKAATTPAPRTNLPMPPVAASQPDGRRVRLEDLRGQVVVLDFWATYCPPCREEIPHLVRLQKQYGPKGLKVIGLNVGGEEDQPKVPDFVKLYGIQYQLADPDEETTSLFLAQDDSIPQTFVLDRRGRLVRHFVGYDSEVASELEAAVNDALAEKAD